MLTILYPKEDYEAADLAIKAQAMSQMSDDSQSIYIVPKHYGRNEDIVFKNLAKSQKALFLVYDKTRIDKETQNELKFLAEHHKEIYCVIPESMKNSTVLSKLTTIHIIPYDKTASHDALTEMHSLIASLEKQKVSSGKTTKNNDNFLILVIGFLAILVLLMAFVAKKK